MPDINEKTSVSLFSVLAAAAALIPLIVAGLMWLFNVDSKASAAQGEVGGLRALILDVRERVIRIEERQTRER